MWNVIRSLVVSLGLTILLESLFFLAAGRRSRRDWLLLVLANAMTNPAVVMLTMLAVYFTDFSLWAVVPLLEISAVVAEWLCYRAFAKTIRRPLFFSLAANAFSFAAGEIILRLV